MAFVYLFQEFITSGSSNNDTGKVFGSLETKYKYTDYGEFMNTRYTDTEYLSHFACPKADNIQYIKLMWLDLQKTGKLNRRSLNKV